MSMGIDALTSYNQMLNTSTSQNVTVSKLKDKLENTEQSKSTDEELMSVCKDFEAYLVEQMFNSMKNMVPKDDDEENDYMEYFGDTMYKEYAKNISETGQFGIAKTLYESMKRQ